MKSDSIIKKETFINGMWKMAGSGKRFIVTNPANGEQIADVPDFERSDARSAIEAAHASFSSWSRTTANERAILMRRWFGLIIQNREALAELMTRESGKVIAESIGEVNYGAAFVEWFGEESKRIYGDVIPPHTGNRRLVVIRQPIGVCAAITPWNFPLAMITRKVSPAIAAGCTVVIKPPSETPLTALALAALSIEAGFPNGVINVVTSSNSTEIGKELCENTKIRKLSFTGSTEVGRILMSQCSSTLKKLSLELGGNAPFIVFEDADIDKAVEGAIQSKYRHNGQTCVCANRFLIHEKVYDEFADKFTAEVKKLKTGDVLQKDVRVGPLINESGLEKVKRHVADAISKGAVITTGGKESGGLFYQPTVFKNATSEMLIAKEEVFGPVAPLFKFSTEQEAVSMANDTEFGLAAYFYSQNVNRCWRVSEALEYGMVGVNEGIISTEVAPFGGIKQSGFGREGSKYGMDEFTVLKYLCYGNV